MSSYMAIIHIDMIPLGGFLIDEGYHSLHRLMAKKFCELEDSNAGCYASNAPPESLQSCQILQI